MDAQMMNSLILTLNVFLVLILCLRLRGVSEGIEIGVGRFRVDVGHLDERRYELTVAKKLQDAIAVGFWVRRARPVSVKVVKDSVDLLPVVPEYVLDVSANDLRLPELGNPLANVVLIQVGVGFVLGHAEHHRYGGELGVRLPQ